MGHFPDVFADCFFQDWGSGTHYSSPSLLVLLVQPQNARLQVNTSEHCEAFFFFCLDIGFISSFGKLIIPDSYFMTSRAFVLVAWILFLPFSWLFSTCLTLPGIWLWLTFMYLCQDSPSPVGYHSACSYPAYLLFCLLVTPPIHYINRLPSLCIHSVRLIQSEWHPNVLPIDPSEVDQCVLLSWLMSSKYRWLYLLRPRQNIGRLCITLVNSTLDGDMCYCLGVGW